MMHCHVCREDIPLGEIVNHVRLLHPDAYPIAERVEVHVQSTGPQGICESELARMVQRAIAHRPPGRTT